MVAGTSSQSYTFTTAGPHKLILQATHPVYGTVSSTNTFTVAMNPLTATICGVGAQSVTFDCSGHVTGTTLFSPACSGLTAPSQTGSTFAVSGISVSETITAYQWQIENSSGVWGNIGTASTYSFAKQINGAASFSMRCFVTTNTGRTGYSNALAVTINSCTQ